MNDELWYYEICNVIAQRSKCHSRKIGAILVKDKTIICQGYNGPPRGVVHCGLQRLKFDCHLADLMKDGGFADDEIVNTCPRQLLGYKSGEGLDLCIAKHGEENCIINAARFGIETKNTIMYMNCAVPCKECLGIIINAGISEIVCTKIEFYDNISEFLIRDSKLYVRTYDGDYIEGDDSMITAKED